ncbi:MAG: hypothetical protein ACRD26_10860 [Vicinamibacterales bacterium]
MPDPSQIAGRALPGPELPDGTVSVRLVREAIGNNITGHDVTVTAGDTMRTAKTDAGGRAQIAGLPAGARAVAEATVDGERLTSLSFEMPSTGGIRVILIAGLDAARARREQEEAEAAKAPPAKGVVVFGGESRIVFEFQNDALRAFYLLEIVNTARTRVETGGPLILDLPRGVGGARLLDGSFSGASVQGDRVTILGPFPPGRSPLQIGMTLPYGGDALTVSQRFPAALQQVTVVAEKVGALHLASPQFTDHRDVRMQDGTPFILATGAAVPAGTALAINLTNLPHQSTWPRNVALALAALILAAGAWLACGDATREHERRTIAGRRDSLYGRLVKLEDERRAGRVDQARYQAKRQHLVAELERVYGELDAPGPPDGDRGLGAPTRAHGGGGEAAA